MIESRHRVAEDIRGLLEALRRHAGGRYACLVEPGGVLFEAAEDQTGDPALRRFLESRRDNLFRIPAAMAAQSPMEDAFDGWDRDQFLLAFVNGRVAAVVACPDAELARQGSFDLLKALADRLFRYDERYRLDAQSRGLFLGRARLDVIAVSGAD